VRACERLYRKGHKVRLILFDTPVDERARKLALDFRCKVPFEFITDHPVKENYSIFQKADIFVGAERKAGWSNTCAEAMASKVAVIATRAGTGDFLVHDVTGLRVYRNSLSLYRALRRLIEDPGLRARLAQAGYERIQRFTWDDLADRILGLFEGYDAAAATGALWPSTARFIQKSKVRNTGFLQILRKRKSNLLQNGVYVFAYHSIVDPACCAEWELAYHHVAINKDAFAAQIGMLINEAVPVRLSQIPDILKNGSADKPYFSITFDDGYSNVRRNAFDVLNVNHIYPTVFVNGAFAGRQQIYYRVLAAMLVASGGTKYLRKCLKREMGTGIPVTSDVLRYMKRHYQYRITEKAVLDAWKMSGRDVLSEKVHMDWQDLLWLQSKGWEMGNHTFTHPVLSQLTYREHKSEIENNITAITKAGLECIKWLAYPNGSARHVNSDTRRWLLENREWHGIFANGGVNLSSTRTEWLRIGVMKNRLDDFRQEIDIAKRKMDALRASS
jgi:peptidoglycan/xylan/chitin deacetylase (PgdA/CDA1 family)